MHDAGVILGDKQTRLVASEREAARVGAGIEFASDRFVGWVDLDNLSREVERDIQAGAVGR
jgi:hypothetical protein